MQFIIEARDGHARAGRLVTPHGEIETPVFMPVGTRGTVKGIDPDELAGLCGGLILANTYHLMLRPGEDLVRAQGGLHRFMAWNGAILTDSGGFQVHSLAALRELSEAGVVFRSHLDGARVELTPERAVAVQEALGSDIVMPLDVCAPYPAESEELEQAVRLTSLWAARSQAAHRNTERQVLFAIVQGGVDLALRRRSAEELGELDFAGYALGGLSVGEPVPAMLEAIAAAREALPPQAPRYLMGSGLPSDIVQAVAQGVDMFDSVLPTRNARNGQAFTSKGRLNMRNLCFRDDAGPLDASCACTTCRRFSRAYLRHLVTAGEILGAVLLTRHNLAFYLDTMRRLRQAIVRRQLDAFLGEFVFPCG